MSGLRQGAGFRDRPQRGTGRDWNVSLQHSMSHVVQHGDFRGRFAVGHAGTHERQHVSEPHTAGSPESSANDRAGNQTSVTDPLSHQTTIALNAAGQLTSVTDPLTHAWQFAYAGGDLTATTDPLGAVRSRFIDVAGLWVLYDAAVQLEREAKSLRSSLRRRPCRACSRCSVNELEALRVRTSAA